MLNRANSCSADALSRAFDARHIAVFGASATPGKWGYVAVDELLKAGYDRKLTLINPRGGEAFGHKFVTADAAQGADLAVIATPGTTAVDIVRQCGELSIPIVVLYASGFSEQGNHTAQAELVAAARAAGVRIVGPNCVGFSASLSKINLSLDPGLPAGNVSLVSQSGSVGLHVGHRLAQLGGGFDVMMTLGNKADIGFSDAIAALVERETTESIVLYLERLDEGDAFLNVVSEAAKRLPIVALLSGQTEAGRQATMSHTGSLVGNWERGRSLLENCGVLVCERLDAVAGAVAGARRQPKPRGRRIYVMCDGGGPSVMMSDALGRANFELPKPSEALTRRLSEIVDERVGQSNPLDFAGAADTDIFVYSKVYESVVQSDEYDAVVIGGIIGGIGSYWGPKVEASELAMIADLTKLTAETNTPLIIQSSYATDNTLALQAFRAAGIPCLEWPDEIAKTLTARIGRPDPLVAVKAGGNTSHRSHNEPSIDPVLVDYTERLARTMDRRGIPHALGSVVLRDEIPEDREGKWVLRLDGIAHKTDAGAIKVGVKIDQFTQSVEELRRLGERWVSDPIVRAGDFVPHAEEIIVTFFRDPSEGAGVVVGAGGTATELKADVAIARLPRDRDDVLRVLLRSKEGRGLFAAYSDTEINAFADVVLALCEMFETEFPELAELEINPIGMTPTGPIVLDVLPTITAVRGPAHGALQRHRGGPLP